MKIYLKFIVLMLIIFTVLFVFVRVYENYFVVNEHENLKYENEMLVDTKEKDTDNVVFYADGMKTSAFLSCLNKKGLYIESDKEEYSKIYYDFSNHLEYEELVSIYNKLNRSSAVKLENIGKTEDNRDMYSLELGFGKKTVMLDAGVHAAEIANPLFLTKFMIEIVDKYEQGDTSTINLFNEYKIVILPSANPDGYEMHLFGVDKIKKESAFVKNSESLNLIYYKGNINGVDINRNMPTEHGGLYYKENTPSSTLSFEPTGDRLNYYSGESMGSEAETQNIMYWILKHYKDSYAYISLHSAGRSIYNGKPNLSDEFNMLSNDYAKVINKYTKYYKIHDEEDEDIGFGNDGTTTDFYSELVSGFKFSSETGRLTNKSYNMKESNLPYKAGSITIETLSNYTNSLETIKSEWETYKLYNVLIDMIKLR